MMNSKLLKALRLHHNMSQAALGRHCHVSQGAVSLWEKGKREPDLVVLKQLSDLFSVPVDLFLMSHTDAQIRQLLSLSEPPTKPSDIAKTGSRCKDIIKALPPDLRLKGRYYLEALLKEATGRGSRR